MVQASSNMRRPTVTPHFCAVLCLILVATKTAAFSCHHGIFSPRRSAVAKPYDPLVHVSPTASRSRTTVIVSQSQDDTDTISSDTLSSPLNDPALATLDVVALLGFAAIGKASHAPDGSIDLGAVLVTAFPFLTAWLATSPLTGIYSDLDFGNTDNNNKGDVAKGALIQTAKGWALAIPLGCALRGVIKGYVPPLPFVIVTLVATLVILGTVRALYAVATTSD
ncbi:Protein of unknown function (DUF3054) [Seminavis robusta]|uniref:Uncharacterized protein n=1 Tax=Seminavis robusta TaxID=568900 RepID=A0A9N8H1U2_9STRA|nr:Protein of unknown function (DUF3054) [Seminavis robusta]|eukprot:Sro8_g006460.1 Protein of unknown function (DUF3054) (223) ;mRNA; r:9324-9992